MASKRTQTFNSEEVNSKYEILKQLGTEGIDGVVMKVRCKKSNNIYAMKIFKNIKSSKNIQNEIKFLIKASKINICPKLIEYGDKWFVMEIMDKTLNEVIILQNNKLTQEQFNEIIVLYQKLSEIKISHNDSNIGKNIMIDTSGKFKLIDFGLSKNISKSDFTKKGPYPNFSLLSNIFKITKQDFIRKFIDDYEKEYNVIIDVYEHQRRRIEERKK